MNRLKSIVISFTVLLFVSGCSFTFAFGKDKVTKVSEYFAIIGDVTRIDEKGVIILEGTLKNITDEDDEEIYIAFELVDKQGDYVDVALTSIGYLAAGQTTTFQATAYTDEKVASYELDEVSSNNSYGFESTKETQKIESEYFEVEKGMTFDDSQYGTSVFGQVKNVSNETFISVEVKYALFNEKDIQIGYASTFLDLFRPGETWKFEAEGYVDDVVASVELVSMQGSLNGTLSQKKLDALMKADVFKVTDVKLDVSRYSTDIVGTIENISVDSYQNMSLYFATYDEDGYRIGIVSASVDQLDTGAKAQFEAYSSNEVDTFELVEISTW